MDKTPGRRSPFPLLVLCTAIGAACTAASLFTVYELVWHHVIGPDDPVAGTLVTICGPMVAMVTDAWLVHRWVWKNDD